MISYKRFWDTMRKRGISQYDLYEHYGLTRSLLDKLRHNKNLEVLTLDRLCEILECDFDEIVEHIPDEDAFAGESPDKIQKIEIQKKKETRKL